MGNGLTVSLSQAGPIALDLAFTCGVGEVLGIYGPSGSGKTTILRTIAGLYTPASAQVTMGSEVWIDTALHLSVPPHRRSVGFVFQDHALFPHLTAAGNVLTALSHRPRRERRAMATELLGKTGLAGKADRRPAELSGGERQRVAMARALARQPAVLLLDEPFASVDPAVRRRLIDLVDTLRQSLAVPIVLVTHDFRDIVRLATSLLVIEAGRAVACGPLREVTSRADLPGAGDLMGRGVVFDAVIGRVDAHRGLAELNFPGGMLVAPDTSMAAGRSVRVRIPAREVILATEVPTGLSLHNALAGVVTDVALDTTGHHAVVRIAIGGEHILSEVTRDATDRLAIRPGARLYVLIKSMSIEVVPGPS